MVSARVETPKLEPAKLAESLATGFDMDELDTLAFQVNVRFEDLKGDTRKAKSRELVKHCERHGMLDALVVAAMAERPNMYWNEKAEDVSAATLRFMVPTIASGTKRLMGMQMARLEGRLNAQAKCLLQVKGRMNAIGAANVITLVLVFMLLLKGLS